VSVRLEGAQGGDDGPMMGRVRGGGLSEPDVKEADDSGLRGGRVAGSRAPATVLTGRTLGPTLCP
jgi:hypothetical protein